MDMIQMHFRDIHVLASEIMMGNGFSNSLSTALKIYDTCFNACYDHIYLDQLLAYSCPF